MKHLETGLRGSEAPQLAPESTPRSSQADRGESLQKQERFLHAGMRCIQRLGLNATTMDDIAAEAGVKRITLYRQFGSRANLIRAIVKNRFDAFNRRFARRMQPSEDFGTLLEEYLRASMRLAIRNPFTRDAIRGRLDFTSPGQPLHTAAREFWAPLIAVAQQAGGVNPDLDIDATSQWILICQFTLCRLALDSAIEPTSTQQLIRSFVLPAFIGRTKG
jgi:AcrR family transcriptional regulator